MRLAILFEDLDDKDEFHRTSVIFVCIDIGNSSATERDASEISTILGGDGDTLEIDADAGCYNIAVDEAVWQELETNGYIEKQIKLASGKIATVHAEMP